MMQVSDVDKVILVEPVMDMVEENRFATQAFNRFLVDGMDKHKLTFRGEKKTHSQGVKNGGPTGELHALGGRFYGLYQ